MSANTGKVWLEKIRRRWIMCSALQVLLYAVAIALILGAILNHFFDLKVLAYLLPLFLCFLLLSVIKKYWQISLDQISSFVDQKFPELEDSTHLLLANPAELSLLQQLQQAKVNRTVEHHQMPSEPIKLLRIPAFMFGISLLFFYFMTLLPARTSRAPGFITPETNSGVIIKENILPQVDNFEIRIAPPGYTGKGSRTQKQFSVLAENGSQVQWNIKTTIPVETLSFIWNDSERIALKKDNKDGTSWVYNKVLTKPGFYQLILNGKKSDFYQVEIVPDQPVAIKIINPEQHTTIDFGQAQQVNLKVLMTDDYGISTAHISATMASGKGEAVSFKEQKIDLNANINNQRSLNVAQQLLLNKLGMKPGDELYFYIHATDNHGQESRSDMYFVSIQDTTELMSLSGMDNGVNLVPEYFRSQRQIIIDTEKLLKERSSISDGDFKKRSNDLGIDQKMLRLRYGKFLGEEEETNIGAVHEEHEEHDEEEGEKGKKTAKKHEEHEEHASEPAAYGDVQSLMDQYAHKHDQAEDATFFEPQLKAQLKATLNEMWTAELKLRTYEPQQALPYEYKALRLLKDLQQKSRAYVAKTTFKTAVLKPEKRLTGELKEIQEANANSKFSNAADVKESLKAALSILEDKKAKKKGSESDLKTLRLAQQELILASSKAPGEYLPSLKALNDLIKNWSQTTNQAAEIATAEKGIHKLLGTELSKPFKSSGQTSDLSKAYFNQLKRTHR